MEQTRYPFGLSHEAAAWVGACEQRGTRPRKTLPEAEGLLVV